MNLKANEVIVRLSDRDIVKKASLQVSGKQFVGLLGPNGSGKTTLLKSIYRILKPAAGLITLDDEDITRLSHRDTAKRMGVVSQFTNLSFDFSVEEIVLMGRAPHKAAFSKDTSEDFRIVEDALKRVNMLEFRNRSFLTLSGGEKQRILLARALAQQVEMMILDEPTNHLDIKYQIQIMDVVKSLNIGVLAALHDLNLTLMYCDYVYMLKAGEVVAHGKPEDIITPSLIRKVYEVECDVQQHPKTGKLNVVYYSQI